MVERSWGPACVAGTTGRCAVVRTYLPARNLSTNYAQFTDARVTLTRPTNTVWGACQLAQSTPMLGKFANWDGGIRVVALVSGGALPPARRGQQENGLVAVWDWLPTYAALAGIESVSDPVAAAAKLPAIDGVDAWPLISGQVSSVREEIVIGDTAAIPPNGDGKVLVGGLIWEQPNTSKLWKLLVGAQDKGELIEMAVTTGPKWPNVSSHLVPLEHTRRCGRSTANGCLYELNSDPTEEHTVAREEPLVFGRLLQRIQEWQAGAYSPNRGTTNPAACEKAEERGFYWGPFLP